VKEAGLAAWQSGFFLRESKFAPAFSAKIRGRTYYSVCLRFISKKYMKILSATILVLILVSLGYLMFGKLGIPDGVTAVTPFDLKRFEGTWYEIARLDHGFEKT